MKSIFILTYKNLILNKGLLKSLFRIFFIFHQCAVRYCCITLSRQSSGKHAPGIISTLIRRIDTGCLWRAVKVLTKSVFDKPNLRGKSMSTVISKIGYGCWRKENSFMQSYLSSTFWQFTFIRNFTTFWRIWRRCLLRTFS